MSNYLGKDLHALPFLQLTLGIGSIALHATSHYLKAGVVALEVVIEPHILQKAIHTVSSYLMYCTITCCLPFLMGCLESRSMEQN